MAERPKVPYDIPLGNREYVRLVLPQDLSEKEADRICGVIRTLAFSDAELEAAEAERAAARQKASDSLGALMAEWAAADDDPGETMPALLPGSDHA